MQKVQPPKASGSDVKMEDDDEDYDEDASSEVEEDNEDSDGSQYGSERKGKKRKGGRQSAGHSEPSPKRARNGPSNDEPREEAQKAEVLNTSTVQSTSHISSHKTSRLRSAP